MWSEDWDRALLCAAQEQAIRTNYVKHYIDKWKTSRPVKAFCVDYVEKNMKACDT